MLNVILSESSASISELKKSNMNCWYL